MITKEQRRNLDNILLNFKSQSTNYIGLALKKQIYQPYNNVKHNHQYIINSVEGTLNHNVYDKIKKELLKELDLIITKISNDSNYNIYTKINFFVYYQTFNTLTKTLNHSTLSKISSNISNILKNIPHQIKEILQ